MLLLFLAISTITFSITRIVLLVMSGLSFVPFVNWPQVLVKGLFFDIATLVYFLPILYLTDIFFTFPIQASRFNRGFRLMFFLITTFLLLFLGVSEVVFWMEFHTRFNFITLDYLIYTNEVIANIWQSYPIVWICISLLLFSLPIARFLARRSISASDFLLQKNRVGVVFLLVLLPFLSYKFVTVDLMFDPDNAMSQEISENGLFTLAAAARRNELDYDTFYATIPQEKANALLKSLGVEWTDDLNRRQNDPWGDDLHDQDHPSFLKKRPRNIVLISVESLSAKFVGAFGSTDGLTPQLDQLAKNGFIFPKLFATGTRTVRGLEALTLATPPIPGQAIIRRPKTAHLASIGEMLHRQNIEPIFFYGGYSYFDNMKSFFEANDYLVFDRTSMRDQNVSFENAWGVADEDLFKNAIHVLNTTVGNKKSFFAHIMTTSNHRPYTYPAGRIDIPSPGGRRGAVKYTDYAIGQFIEEARSQTWFNDTLFVITADHCASVAGRSELPIADYRIPLIFYGPSIIKPGQMNRMISQIDIAPSLLDILGKAGDDNFFGKEIQEQEGPERTFISNYQNLGYYKSNTLVVLKPKRQVDIYDVNPNTYEVTSSTDRSTALVDEAIAYYQTASRAFKLGQLELIWKQ